MMPKLLLIVDEIEAGHLWLLGLRRQGMMVQMVTNEETAVELLTKETFDLVLADLTTPLHSLTHLCQQLRAYIINPILLLTYHRDEPELVELYKAGFDECIIKPIGFLLLFAKIKTWLRRAWLIPADNLENIVLNNFTLIPGQRVLLQNGQPVKLTNLEFRLIHLLMLHPKQPVSTITIIDNVWGQYHNGDNSLLKNVVYRLRRKIEPDPAHPHYLLTLSNGFYLFQAD